MQPCWHSLTLNIFEIYFHPPFISASFSLHLEAWLAAMFCLTWIRENLCDVGAVQKAAPFPSPKWNNVGQGSVWAVDWFATIYRFGLLSLQLLIQVLIDRTRFWLRQRCRTLIYFEVSQADAKALRYILHILHSCSFSLLFSLFLSQLAVCMGTPILTPSWIYQAWAKREDM